MAIAKRVRWECPNGHPAVLASTRPPLDSIDRYCLVCSAKTGRLVKRIAPALETKRTAAKQTSVAKAKAARARMRKAADRAKAADKARFTVEGVDLRDEMGCLLRLKAWKGAFGSPGFDGGFHNTPELTVTRRSSYPGRLGFAEPWRWRIHLAIYPGQSLADARETLVHELTHLVIGHQRGSRSWHGTDFKKLMLTAFKEAYKVGPVGIPDNVYHGRYAAALRRKEKETGNP